jgi:hypothetical protein
MAGVDNVTGDGHVFRIASRSGPETTTAVLDAAASAGLAVESLAVQTTTLDDVFLHFTGRQLRDELSTPGAADSPFMMRR